MPRAGLTETLVVEEAERMVDEVGLAGLTLTALAERLGVRQPSLYKHVDGLDALHRSISVRAKRDLGECFARAAVGRSRGGAIVGMSQVFRRWALAHPGRYIAAQRAPAAHDADDIAASNAIVQVCADVLAGYGLQGDDAIDAIRALRSALHGFVSLETTGGFGLPADIDRSFDRLVDSLIHAMAAWSTSAQGSEQRTSTPPAPPVKGTS
jgi:AcrR family transcriptional regulator